MNVWRYFCALVGCISGPVTAQGLVLSVKAMGDSLHLFADWADALYLPQATRSLDPLFQFAGERVERVLKKDESALLIWDHNHSVAGLESAGNEVDDK